MRLRAIWATTLLLLLADFASADGPAVLPGGVVSSVRGPYGYVAGAIPKGMKVRVSSVSNRVELFPDFALVEQTLTLENDGARVTFWVGVDQEPLSTGRPAVRTFVPLGAAAWIDGVPIPEDDVRVRDRALDNASGYATGTRLTLDAGEHVLTLSIAMQTVTDIDTDGIRRPAGKGPSHLAVELGLGSAGFALDDDTPVVTDQPAAPPTKARTMVVFGTGVAAESLDAFEWTDGALEQDGRIYWQAPVRLGLRYEATGDASRSATADELHRAARAILVRPPRGHLAIPPGATAFTRPGASEARRTEDAQRARRALLVPFSGLFLCLLVLYFYFRRKERRR